MLIIAASLLSACIQVGDVNDSFRRVDRVWQLEYQKSEDLYRYRHEAARLPAAGKANHSRLGQKP